MKFDLKADEASECFMISREKYEEITMYVNWQVNNVYSEPDCTYGIAMQRIYDKYEQYINELLFAFQVWGVLLEKRDNDNHPLQILFEKFVKSRNNGE